MKTVAIQDANIMIDLVKTGCFEKCLALNYEFATTDIILNELYDTQVEIIKPHISSGKFMIIAISEQEINDIQVLSLEDAHLSEQDWSIIYYAEHKNALVISGDRRLKILQSAGG